MTRIKFCGVTRPQDLAVAAELQVDAVGFVLWARSPRGIGLDRTAELIAKLPKTVTPVGVFVQPTREEILQAVHVARIRVAQVHGALDLTALGELPCELWVAMPPGADHASVPAHATILLDAHDPERHGGTGRTIDWEAAGRLAASRRVMLAGGLRPENVGEAIRRAQPYGVDVSSGIEEHPGIKDARLMRAFASAVRSADLASSAKDRQ
jgi:phosphoribosylanthranilate isomerase